VTKPCTKFPRTKGCFGVKISAARSKTKIILRAADCELAAANREGRRFLYQISELRFSSIVRSDTLPVLLVQWHAFVTELLPLKVCQRLEVSSLLLASLKPMELFGEQLALGTGIFLILALLMALSFEFVNGFHDTANAVATVIYTHSLRPVVAVVWSGFCNLMGVLTSSGAVAFGIVALLPVELVLNVGSGAGFAMVFALLISAIIWNVGTWYLGLPASSSHTLVGSIMGVGLANSMITPGHVFGEGVNWAKAQEVFTSLLVSPIVGFVCSAVLLLLAKFLIRRPELYAPAEAAKSPPWWIRLLLIFTCTGVSFSHGSNDGQKGMGLIMLILIGILPAVYALDLGTSSQALKNLETAVQPVTEILDKYAKDRPATADEAREELSALLKTTGHLSDKTFGAIAVEIQNLQSKLQGKSKFSDIPKEQRSDLRTAIYLVHSSITKLRKQHLINDKADDAALGLFASGLKSTTDFIPPWVKVAVAVALGCGTMIGWKRIVRCVQRVGLEVKSEGRRLRRPRNDPKHTELSISRFFRTNRDLISSWVASGRCKRRTLRPLGFA
jgi:PiT family inorganic phosphate transporter